MDGTKTFGIEFQKFLYIKKEKEVNRTFIFYRLGMMVSVHFATREDFDFEFKA